MATSDQPFDQTLLYLRAAGHDTGAETRARLKRFIRDHRVEHPSLDTAKLLETAELIEKVPQWFDLPRPARDCRLPPIARASIGYPGE